MLSKTPLQYAAMEYRGTKAIFQSANPIYASGIAPPSSSRSCTEVFIVCPRKPGCLTLTPLIPIPTIRNASPSWGGYHWARTTPQFTVILGNNMRQSSPSPLGARLGYGVFALARRPIGTLPQVSESEDTANVLTPSARLPHAFCPPKPSRLTHCGTRRKLAQVHSLGEN